MSKTLAEQLKPLAQPAPVRQISKPRCRCHAKPIQECPDTRPAEAQRIINLMSEIAALDTKAMLRATKSRAECSVKPWETKPEPKTWRHRR